MGPAAGPTFAEVAVSRLGSVWMKRSVSDSGGPSLYHPLSSLRGRGGWYNEGPPRFARRPTPARWRDHCCEPDAKSCRVRWPRRVGPGAGPRRGGVKMGPRDFAKKIPGDPQGDSPATSRELSRGFPKSCANIPLGFSGKYFLERFLVKSCQNVLKRFF